MNYQPVIDSLTKQIEQLTSARAALMSLAGSTSTPAKKPAATANRSTITPEGRKRLSEMMRKRWAEQKRKQRQKAAKKKASPKAAASNSAQ